MRPRSSASTATAGSEHARVHLLDAVTRNINLGASFQETFNLIYDRLHDESGRADKPFMNITCTALQDTLLESELFGHEKGAFTDAKSQKKGLFELANNGTVFLDEIGDMSPTLQAKLLRALEGYAAWPLVSEGEPAEEILDHAGRLDVDLIALATHAREGLERMLEGSVAEAVLRGSPVPVLLQKPLAIRKTVLQDERRR